MEELETKIDGWFNAQTGLGVEGWDRLLSHGFQDDAVMEPEQCETLFNIDDLAARVAEALPEETLRQPFDLHVDDTDGVEVSSLIQDELRRLGAHEKFLEAMVWARALGGSALFVGADDSDDPALELNPERVTQIRFLTYLDRRTLMAVEWNADVRADNYGEPSVYALHPDAVNSGLTSRTERKKLLDHGQRIHASRLILFPGARTSPRLRTRNRGWDLSVFQRLLAPLRAVNSNWQSVSNLLTDASQGILKIKGLRALVASKNRGTLEARMRIVNLARSVARVMPIDADQEDFTRVPTPFNGIPELLDKSWLRLAAAARMPVSVLMGQSPAGMQSTGEADLRWWYNTVQAYQTIVVKPRLERLIELLLASSDGPTKGKEPEKWDIRFRPLWGMTAKEEAEVKATMAQADKAYVDAQVLLPEEVAISRFRTEGYSLETHVELDDRQEILEAEMERAVEEAENPPEPPPAAAPGQPGQPPAPGAPAPPGAPGQPPPAPPRRRDGRGRFVTRS